MKNFFNKFYIKVVISAIFIPIIVLSSLSLYIDQKLPNENQLRDIELQVPLKIFTKYRYLIGEFGEKRRSALSFDEIPTYFVKAVLAAEDDNFFNHSGVSYLGLVRSLYRLLLTGKVQGGGSTITMQVAGNYLTGREVNFYRKIKDIYLAYKLEETYSKEEIFEFYVNRIFLGNRAYGIAAASEVYYGTAISNLNLAQWAMIASLPQAPSARNPLTNPSRALIRRNWILDRMLDLGYIFEDQYRLAISAPLTATYHGLVSEVQAPYLAENIRRYMIDEYGLDAYKEGYEVFTSIDSSMQNSANEVLKRGLESYDKRHGFRKPENYEGVFPENFFEDSLAKRIDIVRSSAKYTDTAPPDSNANLLNEVYNLLERHIKTKNKFPTLVISASQDLYVLSSERKAIKISWSQDMEWARMYINENRRGPKPNSYAGFLKEGDLVWISKDKVRGNFSLTQNPEVQGSLVAMDPKSGAVKALVGGYNFFLSKFDRATQSSPLLGSNFKPFLYAAALSEGFTASTLVNDAPIVFDDEELEERWRPRNASGVFFGPTRVREGLVQSRNLVSIRILRELGIEKVRNYSSNFGFNKDSLQPNLSLALGTASLSPLENASAYSVFANGGSLIEPFFIEKIQDRLGNIIFQREYPIDLVQTIDPRVAFIIKDILQESGRRGTARKILDLHRPDFAGKTGTTNDAESTWFTGFNDSLVVSVWVGFDQPRSLGNREFGSSTAVPIWIDFIKNNLDKIPIDKTIPPVGLISIKVDKKNGLRAETNSSNVIFEYFLEEYPPSS